MRSTDRGRLVAWVVSSVMPHEPAVRAWLRGRLKSEEDIDDLIQEAYAKFSALESTQHIVRADAFFFQTVRNLLIDQVRHSRVVRFDAISDIESMPLRSDEPEPDRRLHARRQLETVAQVMERLPQRCRSIFRMRKIEGIPQREIAERLGVSESVVENDSVKGLRVIMQALRDELDEDTTIGRTRQDGQATSRK